jgi:hypothetical protein
MKPETAKERSSTMLHERVSRRPASPAILIAKAGAVKRNSPKVEKIKTPSGTFGVLTLPTKSGRKAELVVTLVRLARYDLLLVDEELRRALFGAADDRQQTGDLLASDET